VDLSSAVAEFDRRLKTIAPAGHHSFQTLFNFRKALSPSELQIEVGAPDFGDASAAIGWVLGIKATLRDEGSPWRTARWRPMLRAVVNDLHALKHGRIADGRRESKPRWAQGDNALSFEDRAALAEKGDYDAE